MAAVISTGSISGGPAGAFLAVCPPTEPQPDRRRQPDSQPAFDPGRGCHPPTAVGAGTPGSDRGGPGPTRVFSPASTEPTPPVRHGGPLTPCTTRSLRGLPDWPDARLREPGQSDAVRLARSPVMSLLDPLSHALAEVLPRHAARLSRRPRSVHRLRIWILSVTAVVVTVRLALLPLVEHGVRSEPRLRARPSAPAEPAERDRKRRQPGEPAPRSRTSADASRLQHRLSPGPQPEAPRLDSLPARPSDTRLSGCRTQAGRGGRAGAFAAVISTGSISGQAGASLRTRRPTDPSTAEGDRQHPDPDRKYPPTGHRAVAGD